MDPEEEAKLAEEALARAAAENNPPPPAEDEGEPPPAEGEQPPAEGEGEPPPPAEELPPPPVVARGSRTFEARIGELSADKRRLREENARLQAELARQRAARGEGEPPPAESEPPPADGPQRTQFASQEEFAQAVREEAARQAAAAVFNEKCNAVEDAGVALDPERWAAAKRNLALLDDDGRLPMELLLVALETDKPEQVLLQLGEDPDRAAALLKMTPTKRALEIAKMPTDAVKPKPASGEPPAPAPRSAAPEPVEPIRGRGAPPDRAAPSDTDDDATWLRKREAQLTAKRIAEAEVLRKLA